MQMRPVPVAFVAFAMLALVACTDGSGSATSPSGGDDATAISTADRLGVVTSETDAAAPTVTEVVGSTTSAPPATTEPAPPSTLAPTTVASTAAPTTTVEPPIEIRELGLSVEGRPIVAERRGTPGGRVVLVIGVIHGDENDGLAILQRLHGLAVPTGIDLWLVDSMNPDGVAADVRHNANQVDLNRNFPLDWGPIGVPGDGQYAGPSAASEPETQAMVAFISEIRPDLTLWYHQDLFRIAPGSGRDGAIRQRYAELTGLPVVSITGGTYTGVAATWARRTLDPGVAFIVELGPTLSDAEADVHAAAVLTIASEPN